ncbi:hypothetical protein FOPE_10336 [Fonsecaea pedrosoi]|nr:hypothetical protein FOPE_10336 [Fonsecaea pedrosoi]
MLQRRSSALLRTAGIFGGRAIYPCLDEAQTLAQFGDLVQRHDLDQPNADDLQVTAILHLSIAVLSILEDFHSSGHDDSTPGWTRFLKASHLLDHATAMGVGNTATIQACTMKAIYLTYAEKFNMAYNAVGQAVQLCYLVGLHDQPKNGKPLSPFEAHMRQRVFWTTYCLEKNIAFARGLRLPYLIRDSDINIQVPPCATDDEQREEMQYLDDVQAFSDYLHSTVQATRLSTEIWDCMLCPNAKRPVDEDKVMAIDAKLQNILDRLPDYLSLERRSQAASQQQRQRYLQGSLRRISRRARILFLCMAWLQSQRTNYFRLQMRRKELHAGRFWRRDRRTCLDIADKTVATVYEFYFSPVAEPLDRYSCAIYLLEAVSVLAAVLLDDNVDRDCLVQASTSFTRALGVLRTTAAGLRLARSSLKRMEQTIAAAETVARSIDLSSNDTAVDPACDAATSSTIEFDAFGQPCTQRQNKASSIDPFLFHEPLEMELWAALDSTNEMVNSTTEQLLLNL